MNRIFYADDDYESVGVLFRLRAPSLAIGLLLGIFISFVTSRFEEVLAHNVQIAFFIPFVVYIAAAVGSQTENIYSRDLRSGKAKFSNYLPKELSLGIIFGLVFGAATGLIIRIWLGNELLAFSVAAATFLAIASAPLVALLVTHGLYKYHKDPAASAGPIGTVIQDMVSIVIYGLVSSALIL